MPKREDVGFGAVEGAPKENMAEGADGLEEEEEGKALGTARATQARDFSDGPRAQAALALGPQPSPPASQPASPAKMVSRLLS